MKLYNTLTKVIDEVQPIKDDGTIGVYTCGPTVYDYAHVGHWFTYIRADLLIRALKAESFNPTWVMNITDVGHLVSDADDGEDKLEKGARREGKTAWEIADFYTTDFMQELRALNITEPTFITKATEHIDDQIALIQSLESKGFTYRIDDGIYFDTAKFPSYAAFAQLDLDEQQAGARVSFNSQKRNPSDFALWKFSPEAQQRDMEWASPWGKGFPGWHIECSAMSMKYLGETIDIHTGGIDHVPVHHTNEIAQSEAATGKPFARHWLHSNHVMVDGAKISKSLANGIRLSQLIDDGVSPEAFRMLVLESHYRKQSMFSLDAARAAHNRLKDLQAMAVLRYQPLDRPIDSASFAYEDVPLQIAAFLSDDLNTPAIVAYLSNVSKEIQTVLLWRNSLPHFETMLRRLDDMLGLKLGDLTDITDEQKQDITARQLARDIKDWVRSDELRDRLTEQGIGVRDTEHGPIWFYL